MKRKLISLILAGIMTISLVGCGGSAQPETAGEAAGEPAKEEAAAETETEAESPVASAEAEGAEKYPEFLTIEVFNSQANFQGIQSGWFAKLVKDKFNMELNIIAPNVAGGGDTLYQTRSAGGNLGDLILTNANKNRLHDLVEAELVLDMTEYLDGKENLEKYREQIVNTSALSGVEGMYCIPASIASTPASDPGEAAAPTNAATLRWDLYQQIGAPELNSLDDLLACLEEMQKVAEPSDSGQEVYALSLFPDWDGDLMQNVTGITAMYGVDPTGYALLDVDTGETTSVLDDSSTYIEGLRFFFKANQKGLVDPDSTSQNFDTVSAKTADGAVLYAMWPWLGQGYYNTSGHTAEGKGMQPVPVAGTRLICWGQSSAGNLDFCMMVGSGAKDPQRMVDFIDWLYSPEGIDLCGNDTSGSVGPEGLTWEMKDGQPVLTDFGVKVLIDGDKTIEVPAEWGTGTYDDGKNELNYQCVGTKDINPNTGTYYNYTLWDDYLDRTSTPLSQDYEEKTGFKTSLEYLQSLDQIAVIPGTDWSVPDYPTDIATIKEQCSQIIKEYSWRMVFASNEAEFDTLLKEMQDTAYGLGYNDVLAIDEQNAAARFEKLEAARN